MNRSATAALRAFRPRTAASRVPLVLWLLGTLWLAPQIASAQRSGEPPERAPAPKSLADLTALSDRVQQLVREVTPAVVAVSSGGAGVVVSEDGYVLTVAHVAVRSGRRVSVTFPDGRSVRAETLGNDQGVDAGLLKILGEGPWPCVQMGPSDGLKVGQWCVALGYPVTFTGGESPAVRIGRVLLNQRRTIITDCTIMGGDSGGPLFDLDGKVIAVSSRCNDQLTFNVHVPANQYRDSWARLTRGEDFDSSSPGEAYLGVLPEPDDEGTRVAEVYPGTAAEQAGIQAGDLVVRIAGKEISDYQEVAKLIGELTPGEKVEIELRRGDKQVPVTAVLGAR